MEITRGFTKQRPWRHHQWGRLRKTCKQTIIYLTAAASYLNTELHGGVKVVNSRSGLVVVKITQMFAGSQRHPRRTGFVTGDVIRWHACGSEALGSTVNNPLLSKTRLMFLLTFPILPHCQIIQHPPFYERRLSIFLDFFVDGNVAK